MMKGEFVVRKKVVVLRRRKYSNSFKLECIKESELLRGHGNPEIAKKYKLSKSLLSKWVRNKDKIRKEYLGEPKEPSSVCEDRVVPSQNLGLKALSEEAATEMSAGSCSAEDFEVKGAISEKLRSSYIKRPLLSPKLYFFKMISHGALEMFGSGRVENKNEVMVLHGRLINALLGDGVDGVKEGNSLS